VTDSLDVQTPCTSGYCRGIFSSLLLAAENVNIMVGAGQRRTTNDDDVTRNENSANKYPNPLGID
jgi:hypothetical protein